MSVFRRCDVPENSRVKSLKVLLRTGLFIAMAGLGIGATAQAPAPPLRIAAAASMQPVLAELVPLFERERRAASGATARPRLTLGSSANLARQIQQGLPVELFMSADEAFVFRLADAGLTAGRGVIYATGRLVLLVPAGSSLPLDPQMAGLKSALADVQKFAIANPELAPYGRAAREALQKLALWNTLQERLVLGDNIAQATQFVSAGAAQAGVTALSMVVAPEVAQRVRYVLLPDSLHAPIRQRMVLLKNASPQAQAFYDFLQSPPAQAVLAKHGFQVQRLYEFLN